MSLRRSPRLTPAALAARRANAQKSTGPRTPLGKQRSAANLLRTRPGRPADFWERSLSRAVIDEYLARRDARDTVLPDYGEQTVLAAASDLVRAMRTAAELGLRPRRRQSRRRLEVSS